MVDERQSLRETLSKELGSHFATTRTKHVRGVKCHVCTCGTPYPGPIREHLVDVVLATVEEHL